MKFTLAFYWIGMGTCLAQVIVCDSQHWKNPQPHAVTMNDVIRTRGFYYAVGNNGLIQKSTNGTAWEIIDFKSPSKTKYHLHSIVYVPTGDMSGLVMAGDDGAKLWSADYQNVLDLSWDAGYDTRDIVLGPSQLVFVDYKDRYDGRLGVAELFFNTSFYYYGSGLNAGAIDNGVFHFVGADGFYLYGSDAGALIQGSTPTNKDLVGVTARNGTVCVMESDGTVHINDGSWNTYQIDLAAAGLFRELNQTDQGFMALGDYASLYTSPDGQAWQQQAAPTQHHLYGVVRSNPTVVVGRSGTLLTSADEMNWTSQISGYEDAGFTVAFQNARFLAVGRSTGIGLTSNDGMAWTPLQADFSECMVLHEFAGGELALGRDGTIRFSADGVQWTDVGTPSPGEHYQEIVGWNTLVALGNFSQFMVSSDGQNWMPVDHGFPATFFFDVCQGPNGRFVAVGQSGAIAYSDDGMTWSPALGSGLTPEHYSSVAYGAGIYVATGTNGCHSFSTDGNIWQIGQLSQLWGDTLFRLQYTQGKFWGIEWDHTNADRYVIWSSDDGITWRSHVTESKARIYSELAINGTQLIGAGSGGALVGFRDIGPNIASWPQSEDVISLSQLIHSCL